MLKQATNNQDAMTEQKLYEFAVLVDFQHTESGQIGTRLGDRAPDLSADLEASSSPQIPDRDMMPSCCQLELLMAD